MSITAAIKKMIADGFTVEQALAAAEAFEHAMTPQKTARQERNARYYASKKRLKASNSSYSDEGVLNKTPSRAGVARGLDNLPTEKISGQKEEKKNTPRDELAAVLDVEHADAVIEHRARLRKPLTQRAAQLLARKLAKAPDPNAAADLMVEKGWQSFEPEWFDKPQPRAAAPPKPPDRTVHDVLDDIKTGKLEVFDLLTSRTHEPAHDGLTIDASYQRSDGGGAGNPVQVYAFPSGRRS